MKIILAAVNAKYIHSNLAVYSLRAFAKAYVSETKILEYTINQQMDEILMDLYREKPDLLCFLLHLESGLCGGAGKGDQKKFSLRRFCGLEVLRFPTMPWTC